MLRAFCILAAVVLLPRAGNGAGADDFYKGKTVKIVVGFSAGGGFDTYARTIARHLGKHVAGIPSIIVENMTGAGSLIAANHVYKAAKPDGLTSVISSAACSWARYSGNRESNSTRVDSNSSARRSAIMSFAR